LFRLEIILAGSPISNSLVTLNESTRLYVTLPIIDFKLISGVDKLGGLAHLRRVDTSNEFMFASVPLFTDVSFSVSIL